MKGTGMVGQQNYAKPGEVVRRGIIRKKVQRGCNLYLVR